MTAKFMPFVVFAIANWAMLIAFVVFWARNASEARPHLQTGLILVALYLALESVALQSIGGDVLPKSMTLVVISLGTSALRICAFAVVGLLIVERLNQASSAAGPTGAAGHHVPRYGLFKPSRQGVAVSLAAVLFMLVYSSALFRLTDASPSAFIQQQVDSNVEINFALLLAVVSAGFAEEIVYRLGLQNALTYWWRHSRFGHHWAVVATSALWSVGHIGAVEPEWVKMTQVFVFGVILGHLNRRFGIGACIIVHSLFNATMAAFSTIIIGI